MNLVRGAWFRLFAKGGSKSEEEVVVVTGVATRRVEGTFGPESGCSKGKIKISGFWNQGIEWALAEPTGS